MSGIAIMNIQTDGAASAAAQRAAQHVGVVALGLTVALLGLFLALPLGIGGDYPNHLARNAIEARLAASAMLQQAYVIEWGFIPDLFMDVFVPPLVGPMGAYGAGALIAGIACALPPLAGLVLSRRLHGAASGALPLIGFTTLFSLNMEFGLFNFIAASGFAILAFALWVSVAPGWRRTLMFAPIGLGLVLSHALGFLLLGYIALLWEIASFARGARGDRWSFARGLVLRDGLAFAPGLAILAASVLLGAEGLRPVEAPPSFWSTRDIVLFAPFRFFTDAGAVATAIVSTLVVYGGMALAVRRRILVVDPRMGVVCAGLAALMFAIPEHVLGIWGLHFRYGGALVILLAASVRFAPGREGAGAALAGLLVVIIVAQVHNALPHMMRFNESLTQVRAALGALPKGARVLQAYGPGAEIRLTDHAGALAVIEADAYVPSLFTNTSPVGVAPAMRARHLPAGLRLSAADLVGAIGAPPPEAANNLWSFDYFHAWPDGFTHVLFMRRRGAEAPDLGPACPIADGAEFVLYQVTDENNPRCR